MSTPDYYKYDDGETHFECFDISRYYSGDWAQVIQYVFRWQKKGGVEDLKKALACAKDAWYNAIECKIMVNDSRTQEAISRKLLLLQNNNHASACELWRCIRIDGYVHEIITELEEMIEGAQNETV